MKTPAAVALALVAGLVAGGPTGDWKTWGQLSANLFWNGRGPFPYIQFAVTFFKGHNCTGTVDRGPVITFGCTDFCWGLHGALSMKLEALDYNLASLPGQDGPWDPRDKREWLAMLKTSARLGPIVFAYATPECQPRWLIQGPARLPPRQFARCVDLDRPAYGAELRMQHECTTQDPLLEKFLESQFPVPKDKTVADWTELNKQGQQWQELGDAIRLGDGDGDGGGGGGDDEDHERLEGSEAAKGPEADRAYQQKQAAEEQRLAKLRGDALRDQPGDEMEDWTSLLWTSIWGGRGPPARLAEEAHRASRRWHQHAYDVMTHWRDGGRAGDAEGWHE